MDSTSKNAVTKTVEVEGTPFAYREVGPTTGIPVVFLHLFTAVLDDWDPGVVDGIAAERRVILAGTAPAGDPGPASTGAILQAALEKAGAQGKHPKHFLFFSPIATSQAAADAFLARLDERTEDRDAPVSNETIGAQITALAKWERGTSPVGLTNVDKPVLVVNGDDDTMLPTSSSLHLAQLLPDAQLSIYPDSGHGGIFQRHDLFVAQALEFLRH
jgi:pimeloyl-ACP methyl ester carboxylesterase